MLGFAFCEDPGVTFRVESSITLGDNQILKNMINTVLSTLMRKTFLELWVLPSWRTAFLPLLEPSLEEWLVREQENSALETERKVFNLILILKKGKNHNCIKGYFFMGINHGTFGSQPSIIAKKTF
jgi:hypothetical protein